LLFGGKDKGKKRESDRLADTRAEKAGGEKGGTYFQRTVIARGELEGKEKKRQPFQDGEKTRSILKKKIKGEFPYLRVKKGEGEVHDFMQPRRGPSLGEEGLKKKKKSQKRLKKRKDPHTFAGKGGGRSESHLKL